MDRKQEVNRRWVAFLADRFPIQLDVTYPRYKRQIPGEPDHAKAARFFGVESNVVGAWMKGITPPLHSPTLAMAVESLRLNLTWLVTGQGSPHLDEDVAVQADLADHLYNYVVAQLAQSPWEGDGVQPNPGSVESRKVEVRRDFPHRPETLLATTLEACRNTWSDFRRHIHYDIPKHAMQPTTSVGVKLLFPTMDKLVAGPFASRPEVRTQY